MNRALAGLMLFASVVASPLRAQTHRPLPRWGLVAGFGIGRGSGDVHCDVCRGSQSGPSMHARVGGALRADLLLVAELDGYSSSGPASPSAPATSLLALDVMAQWYPWNRRGYFVSAGLGGGRVESSNAAPPGSSVTSPTGAAFKIGTGYDITVTRSLAVTPFASFVSVGGGTPRGFTQTMSGKVYLVGVQANLTTRQLIGPD